MRLNHDFTLILCIPSLSYSFILLQLKFAYVPNDWRTSYTNNGMYPIHLFRSMNEKRLLKKTNSF